MKTSFTLAVLPLLGCLVCPTPSSAQALSQDQRQLHREVARLAGIDIADAGRWLERERQLVDLARSAQPEEMRGFGGIWIDRSTHDLVVAFDESASQADVQALERKGMLVETVPLSLAELQAEADVLAAMLPPGLARQIGVDVPGNGFLLRTEAARLDGLATAVNRVLLARGVTAPVRIEEFDPRISFSTWIKGGELTINRTWDIQYYRDRPHKCSVGFGTPGAFVTAGHCGHASHEIWHGTGVHLGYVGADAYFSGHDTAIVNLSSGWWSSAVVSGSNGDVAVPAKWAGISSAPNNAMVCRYGGVTGGPHCGTIVGKDRTATLGINEADNSPVIMYGLIEVASVCTDEGDSGGAVVDAGKQAQGTLTGGVNNGCGGQAHTYGGAYVAPISQHMTNHAAIVLTSHGPFAATVSNFKCPDMAHSGSGQFLCSISHYNSQGLTTVSWSGTGWSSGPSNGSQFWGSCFAGQNVSMTLQVFNAYGTYTRSSNFSCPMGPIP